jgi:hypothetical protein
MVRFTHPTYFCYLLDKGFTVSSFHFHRLVRSRPIAVGVAALLVGILSSVPAQADSLKEDTSLGYVPADAAFYSSMQRGGEIGQRIVGSNAYQRISNSSLVQFGMMMLQAQAQDPESPLAQIRAEMDKPENQELSALLCDMFSHEVFCYGDRRWVEFFEVYTEAYREMYRMMQDPETMRRMQEDDDRAMIEVMGTLIDRLPDLEIPACVTGFKVTDVDRAKRQLARLEAKLLPLVNSVPEIEGSLKRRTIGDDEHLTFTLDGTMIPWDEVRSGFESAVPRSAQDEELFEKLKADLEKRKVMITLGVHDDYLLLTSGPNLRHLKQMGQGELLVDSPEFVPVLERAEKPLVGIGYVSKEMMDYLGFSHNTVEMWVEAWKGMACAAAAEEDLDKELLDRILADADEAGEDLKGMIPEAGAALEVSFLTDRGLEGYVYHWADSVCMDGSKPLTLLEHVGGSPLFFAVGRSHWMAENYGTIAKWVGRGIEYGDVVAEMEMDEAELAKYHQVKDAFMPLLGRLDRANRELLLPAFADGQGALVLDSQMTSKRWCDYMPPSAKPLPLFELAVVCGVSDAELLKQGVVEYINVINAALAELRRLAPDEVPPVDVPLPSERFTDAGAMYFYPLPENAKVDERILPNAGLTEDLAVVALSPDHTQRLLKETTPPRDGPLADSKRPLAGAAYFNWSALMDAVTPWIEYASAADDFDENDADSADGVTADIGTVSTLKSIMEVLKCFHCYSSATYMEDGATITHYELHFQDAADASE